MLAVAVATAGRRRVVSRRWLVTPIIVALALAATTTVVFAKRHLVEPTATLSVRATADGDRLRVEGETDLPDGAVVDVGAYHEDLVLLHAYASATVDDGRYNGSLSLERWPVGTIHVLASFGVDESQPPSVVEKFGPEGEALRGPAVHEDSDGFRTIQGSATVDFSHGLAPDNPAALREPVPVMGVVTDEAGELLESATVDCRSATEADTIGETEVFGGLYECVVQPGRYRITARAPGYAPRTVEVELNTESEGLLDFRLERSSAP